MADPPGDRQARDPAHAKKLRVDGLRIHYSQELIRSPCWACLDRYDRLLLDVIHMKLVEVWAKGEWINGSIPISQSYAEAVGIPKQQIDRARFNLKYWGLIDYRIGQIRGVNTAATTYQLTFYEDAVGNPPSNDWMCWELKNGETLPSFRKRNKLELLRIYKRDRVKRMRK